METLDLLYHTLYKVTTENSDYTKDHIVVYMYISSFINTTPSGNWKTTHVNIP